LATGPELPGSFGILQVSPVDRTVDQPVVAVYQVDRKIKEIVVALFDLAGIGRTELDQIAVKKAISKIDRYLEVFRGFVPDVEPVVHQVVEQVGVESVDIENRLQLLDVPLNLPRGGFFLLLPGEGQARKKEESYDCKTPHL